MPTQPPILYETLMSSTIWTTGCRPTAADWDGGMSAGNHYN